MEQAVLKHGWDGEWFLRAYDAYGHKVGSNECDEVQFSINKIICVLLSHGCIAAIKEAFNRMGLDAGSVAYTPS